MQRFPTCCLEFPLLPAVGFRDTLVYRGPPSPFIFFSFQDIAEGIAVGNYLCLSVDCVVRRPVGLGLKVSIQCKAD